MTFPLSGADPGETEFSHGRGMMASQTQRGRQNENTILAWPYDKGPDGPFAPRVHQIAAAVRRTDSADPNAVADFAGEPGTPANTTQTQWVREK